MSDGGPISVRPEGRRPGGQWGSQPSSPLQPRYSPAQTNRNMAWSETLHQSEFSHPSMSRSARRRRLSHEYSDSRVLVCLCSARRRAPAPPFRVCLCPRRRDAPTSVATSRSVGRQSGSSLEARYRHSSGARDGLRHRPRKFDVIDQPRVAMRDWREGLARAWPKAGWRALAPLSLLSAPMSGGAKQHPNLSFG